MNRRDFLHLLTVSAFSSAAGCEGHAVGRPLAALAPQTTPGAGFAPDVDLVLTASLAEVSVLTGALTRVWRFSGKLLAGPGDTLRNLPGSYLGPIISLRRGQKVRIRFHNQLAEPSIIHWHGLDVPQSADGHPRLVISPGQNYVYEFKVTNRAGLYWYHPHPHLRTGAQVYQGLAGVLLVRDAEEDALALPSGTAEHVCVLQDRTFDEQNQLIFRDADMGGMMAAMNGFLGEQVLVNGRPEPTTEVDAGWQRVRLLNGSNARIYKLAWSHNLQMVVIGVDGGLLEHPLHRGTVTLAPGQRADVLLNLTNLAAGTAVHLDSQAFAEAEAGSSGNMGMMGGGSTVPNGAPLRAMTLRTGARKGVDFRVPARLCSFDAQPLGANSGIRRVSLSFEQMKWLLDGRTFDMTDVAPEETVVAGSTHIWDLVNLTNPMGIEAAHPIHIHGRQFRVVRRSGGDPANSLRAGIVDSGWRDTVLVLPGETVRLQVTFTRHPGLYLYHCHILEHEDMGMMRNLRVT